MKHIKLVVLSLASLIFGRPAGFCTANTVTEDVAALKERQDKLEAENAELRRQLAVPPPEPDPITPDSPLAMLCRGAGVDPADVRWRIQAGLDNEQAVEAALAQKKHDEAKKK